LPPIFLEEELFPDGVARDELRAWPGSKRDPPPRGSPTDFIAPA
jgi:hypothetical protein